MFRHKTQPQTLFSNWTRLFRFSTLPEDCDQLITEAEKVFQAYGLENTYLLPNGDIVGPYNLAGEFDYHRYEIKEELGMIDYDYDH